MAFKAKVQNVENSEGNTLLDMEERPLPSVKSDVQPNLASPKIGGKIIIKLINPKRAGTFSIGSISENWKEYGIPRVDLKDENGEEKPYFVHRDGQVLDLTDPYEAKVYDAARFSPNLYLFPVGKQPFYELVDPDKQDDEVVKEGDTKAEAYGLIAAMNTVERRDFYRLWVDLVNVFSDKAIVSNLYKEVEKNAANVIERYNDLTRDSKEVILNAKENASIYGFDLKMNLGRWQYKGELIGNTLNDAVEYFHKNQDELRLLRNKVFAK